MQQQWVKLCVFHKSPILASLATSYPSFCLTKPKPVCKHLKLLHFLFIFFQFTFLFCVSDKKIGTIYEKSGRKLASNIKQTLTSSCLCGKLTFYKSTLIVQFSMDLNGWKQACRVWPWILFSSVITLCPDKGFFLNLHSLQYVNLLKKQNFYSHILLWDLAWSTGNM